MRYRNPPIVEALVDIHVSFVGDAHLAAAATMEGEHVRYPTRLPMTTTSWRVSPSEIAPAEQKQVGYRYESEGTGRVVLVRFDGFTFSQHQPYPTNGWGEWTIEARRLWHRYADAFVGATVTRVAVRYINRLRIDEGQEHELHFNVGPRVPERFGRCKNFLLRTELSAGADIGATVLLTHGEVVLEPGEQGRAFLLDFDISSPSSEDVRSAGIWNRLDELHSLVGPLFEQSLTEYTKESLR